MSGKYKFLPSHTSEEIKVNTSIFQWRKMQSRGMENEKCGFFSRDGLETQITTQRIYYRWCKKKILSNLVKVISSWRSSPGGCSVQFSSVIQSCLTLCDPMKPAACQASLSITNSQSPPKPMSINSVMPSNRLILCLPLLLLPSIFPNIRVFSNESALHIRCPKYWSFSFTSVLPMNTQDWSPLGWTGWISLQSKGLPRVFSNTTVQKHQFFGAQLSL